MTAIQRYPVVFAVVVLSLLALPASALAALTPAPASYDWGNVNRYGTSPSQTFTFTNDEGSPVNVSSVSLSGTDASQFSTFDNNCPGANLNDGDSCSVAVQVQPTSAGPQVPVAAGGDIRSRVRPVRAAWRPTPTTGSGSRAR